MSRLRIASIVPVILMVGLSWTSAGAQHPPGPFAPTRLPDGEGLDNLFQLTAELYSGSEPRTAEAFARLRTLGIQTVVSVDGMRPAVELARAEGLQYIHIPLGYDALPPEAVARLGRLAREQRRGVYVHCHQGRHRGPAAAAIYGRLAGVATAEQGRLFLEAAGTSPDYPGLWQAVAELRPPTEGELRRAALQEVAEVADFTTTMAELDRTVRKLAEFAMSDDRNVAESKGGAGQALAALARESLREAGRHVEGPDAPVLTERLRQAETLADRMRGHFEAGRLAEARAAFRGLQQACSRCHAEYRN